MATRIPDSDPLAYDNLPQAFRDEITRDQWRWLSDDERRRYLDNETEPEPEP